MTLRAITHERTPTEVIFGNETLLQKKWFQRTHPNASYASRSSLAGRTKSGK